MIEWQDETDGQVSRTKIGVFRVTVHRHMDYEPDQWLASYYPEAVPRTLLASTDLEQAKCQAVAKLQMVCEEALRDIVPVTLNGVEITWDKGFDKGEE